MLERRESVFGQGHPDTREAADFLDDTLLRLEAPSHDSIIFDVDGPLIDSLLMRNGDILTAATAFNSIALDGPGISDVGDHTAVHRDANEEMDQFAAADVQPDIALSTGNAETTEPAPHRNGRSGDNRSQRGGA